MIPINVFYDPEICSAKDIILDYMQDIPVEYQTKKYYGEPVFLKNSGQIKFKDSVIVFIPIKKENLTMRAKIAFIPEHMKDTSIVNEVICPIMRSPLLGYYNQYKVKTIK